MFGTHIFLTIRTGLVQPHLWTALKLSVTKERGAELTVGLLTFVFSTILGWSYYGERATEYL